MSQETFTDLIPVAIILVLVIARLIFVYGGRRGSGGGVAGMAVCRKCGRAFPRSLLSPNLIVGKLTHCPHCGALAILPAASQAELDLARARESAPEAPAAPTPSAEEELRRRIEQSKYEK
jgi:hypothetical protein